MRRTNIAKHYQISDLKKSHCIIYVASFNQLGIPVSSVKKICRWHQEDGCMEHCSLSGFPQIHPKGNTGLPFSWQHETDCNLLGEGAECGFCDTPSAQEWYSTDNNVVVTELVVQCGQSWMCSITRCATKLIWNYWHWDQSLHSYPPIICLQRPRSNPLFQYHQNPSPICDSLPGFLSCKCCWHSAISLTGTLIRTLLWMFISRTGQELMIYEWYQQCGVIYVAIENL